MDFDAEKYCKMYFDEFKDVHFEEWLIYDSIIYVMGNSDSSQIRYRKTDKINSKATFFRKETFTLSPVKLPF